MSPEQVEVAMRHMYEGGEGGFAAKLADAWFVADSFNRRRIEEAFKLLIERSYSHAQSYAKIS